MLTVTTWSKKLLIQDSETKSWVIIEVWDEDYNEGKS